MHVQYILGHIIRT